MASPIKSWPSTFVPGIAIKRSPSSTWEEFNFTPVTVTFGIFRDG
jgi:hypothetical protein